jgi:hypothetical protein
MKMTTTRRSRLRTYLTATALILALPGSVLAQIPTTPLPLFQLVSKDRTDMAVEMDAFKPGYTVLQLLPRDANRLEQLWTLVPAANDQFVVTHVMDGFVMRGGANRSPVTMSAFGPAQLQMPPFYWKVTQVQDDPGSYLLYSADPSLNDQGKACLNLSGNPPYGSSTWIILWDCQVSSTDGNLSWIMVPDQGTYQTEVTLSPRGAQVLSTQVAPTALSTATIINNSGASLQRSVSLTYTKEQQTSFSVETSRATSITLEVGLTVKVEFPELAEVEESIKSTTGITNTTTINNSSQNTHTETLSETLVVDVPPNTSANVSMLVTNSVVSMPYTATLYRLATSGQRTSIATWSGQFSGVKTTDTKIQSDNPNAVITPQDARLKVVQVAKK